jgi:rSAM/selenodomain-associated transferase 2
MLISVIIPVLHEAERINRVIEHVSGLSQGSDVEIIVADGDLAGTTINVISNRDVIKVVSGRGRGRQMNVGVTASKGEVLLFLHVDTQLPPDGLEKVDAVMKSGRYAGGAFDLGIDSGRTCLRIIELAASIRSRLTRIPYGDQAIFVARDIFSAIGGFRDFPIMEDVELMRSIRKSGRRIIIIPRKVRTSPRRWEREGVVYCTARNWLLVALYLLGVRPDTLARLYK